MFLLSVLNSSPPPKDRHLEVNIVCTIRLENLNLRCMLNTNVVLGYGHEFIGLNVKSYISDRRLVL